MKKTKKKQPRRTGVFYLTRDDRPGMDYEIFLDMPYREGEEWFPNKAKGSYSSGCLCFSTFEDVLPKKFHLKPGDGPLKVKLVEVK